MFYPLSPQTMRTSIALLYNGHRRLPILISTMTKSTASDYNTRQSRRVLKPGFILWYADRSASAGDRLRSTAGMLHSSPGTPQSPSDTLQSVTDTETQQSNKRSMVPKGHASSVLVLLFPWLFASPRGVAKYIQLYTSRGYDVLQIQGKLLHFLWPPYGKAYAKEIGDVLNKYCLQYQHHVMHGMSIGAYVYTLCIMLARESPEMHERFASKVRACVFDSLTLGSLDHMLQGITTGVSDRPQMQKAIACMVNLYFTLTRKTTVDELERSVDFFKQFPLEVPTLVFGCENDPMSDATVLSKMVADWKVKGRFPVSYRLWEKSGHCAHLRWHQEEYVGLLDQLLATLDIASDGAGQTEERPQATLKSRL